MKGNGQRWIILLLLAVLRVEAEPVVELGPYVVEAWHFDGLGMEIPASVVRLERVDLETSGAWSVPQVLEQAAGVRFRQFTGTGAEGQLALRGFGDNSGLRVLVLVDGQVYNPPDMGGINWLGLSLGELETVEVLRGGQTVLYGNHAVSGVVKLRTREPGGELAGNLEGEFGSDATRRASASLQQALGTVGLRGGLDWMESKGYRENSDIESRTGHLSWNVGGTSGPRWRGRFTAGDSAIQFPGPLTYGQFRENPRQSNNGGKERVEAENWQATLMGEGQEDWGSWQMNGGVLQRQRQSNLEGRFGDNRQRQLTLSPRVRLGDGKGFLMTGLDIAGDEVRHRDYTNEAGDILRSFADIGRLTVGGYLFSSRELSSTLELSGGLRLETARSANDYVRYEENQLNPFIETNRGTFPNPEYQENPDIDEEASYDGTITKSGWSAEVSLVKKLSQGLNLWAGWDRVYRYPALDETASYQGFPLRDPLNVNLEPETGHNFEAGLKRFEDNWHLSATVFHLRMDDEISFSESERLNINIGDTVRSGLELNAAYRKDRYGISMHATVVRTEFEDESVGKRLPLVPRYEGGLTGWFKPVDSLRIQLHGRYLSSQVQGNDFANAFRRIPAYGIVDLMFRWNPHPQFVVSGGIHNLFDRNHAVSAYSGGFYPGPGRQAFIRLNYSI
ncbi:MAG: TonB-dependent receptor [Puniceicoccaceae bacterium]